MKCLQVQFPQNLKQLQQYTTKKQFINKIQSCCYQFLYDQYLFQYQCYEDKNGEHSWICCQCSAFIKYQKCQDIYRIVDVNGMHVHALELFKKCNARVFDMKINPKKFMITTNTFTQFTTINTKQIPSLISHLREEWKTIYPLRCIPKLTYFFYNNNQSLCIQCKEIQERGGIKCPFKVFYELVGKEQKSYGFRKCSELHRHLLTRRKEKKEDFLGEIIKKRNIPESVDGNSVTSLQNSLQANNPIQNKTIFHCLQNLLQTIKQKGYQILVPTPSSQDRHLLSQMQQQGQQQNKLQTDEQDYLILTTQLGKKQYKSYGNTLIISQIFLNQKKGYNEQYYGLCFHGYNCKYHNIIFALALCKNITRNKNKKIIKFFYQNFQNKYHVIFINYNNQQLFNVIQQVNKQLRLYNRIQRYLTNRGKNINYIDLQIERINAINLQINDKCLNNLQLFEVLKSNTTSNFFSGLSHPLIVNTNCLEKFQYYFNVNRQISQDNHNHNNNNNNNNNNRQRVQKTLIKICEQSTKKNERWRIQDREDRIQIQKYYKNENIKKLRIILGRRPFWQFINQFNKVKNCVIEVIQLPYFYLIQDCNYSYIISACNSENGINWRCECNYRNRTGIACCHEMRVLMEEKESLLKAMNRFWVIDQGLMDQMEKYVPIVRKPRIRNKVSFLRRGGE